MEHVRTSAVLTLAGARAALDAALAHARSNDLRMNVAVVDTGGVLLSFARMDGAFSNSGPIAIDKARTSVGFGGAPTADLYAALAGEDAVIRGIANRPGVAAFGGAVPIRVDGELVGAIGASGGSAEQDAQVATAGADAVGA
ncbi:heme-binding protein [Janibacter cremeus]|uniref:GlcG/HbpS family heme-binding protein n=1 Tax=Janibacter cremeus TaxID=1285192 RepID=UPI0023F67F6F|nr:heme-binding protein [Janibacter cremeus]WEV77413.1 heme-binding protein [Janibacter cremeus]